MRIQAGMLSAAGFLCALSGARADVDKAKLRDAAYMRVPFHFNFTGGADGKGFVFTTDENPPPPDPDAIEHTLHDRLEDADTYLQLATLYPDDQKAKQRGAESGGTLSETTKSEA